MKAFFVVSDRLFALLGLLTIQFVAYSMMVKSVSDSNVITY